MDMHLDAEQELIRETAATFLAAEFAVARLHKGEDAFDVATRRSFAGLGWLGMTLSEDHGGVGYSIVEEMLVLRECGRVLAAAGIVPVVLAARLASEVGNADLAREIAAGAHGVFLAIPRKAGAPPMAPSRARFACLARRMRLLRCGSGRRKRSCLTVGGASLDWRPSLDRSIPVARAAFAGAPIVARTSAEIVKRAGRVLRRVPARRKRGDARYDR